MKTNSPLSGASVFPDQVFPIISSLGIALLVLLTCSGCSTTEMKGTPFYSGEYSKRLGPIEERISVWPLFYYREPAVSVLWPVFELTEDHAAVRPLFSVYGLDETNQEYNVLWPLIQFNQRSAESHVFPIFWGKDYSTVFPLYWHSGEPFGPKGGSDTLFPLWHLSRKDSERFNLYSPWPLIRFWADTKKDCSGSMILPLYYQHQGAQRSDFFSLPWWSQSNSDGDFWRLLLPVYYEMKDGDSAAMVTPLWAQGHKDRDEWHGMLPFWLYESDGDKHWDLSAPWPLIRAWSDGAQTGGSRILPLYWYENEPGASRFLSPLYSTGRSGDARWQFLTPAFYQSSDSLESKLITPLYSQGHVGETDWSLLVPLYYSSHANSNQFKLYSPLAYFWRDRQLDEHGSVVIPLYAHQYRAGASQFTSLLWMQRHDANGDFWRLLPPLFYQESNSLGSRLITPLWAHGKTETNDWTAVFPLAYWDRQEHTLLSPLWAHWRNDTEETWLAPWTLSWLTRSSESSDLNFFGGLARASWGATPKASYVVPLYYRNPATETLLSPVWLQWRGDESQTALAPWLLSWRIRETNHTDLWLAGGLARTSWGERPSADYVFPIFYHNSRCLLTPVFGWDNEANFRYFATPLAGGWTGDKVGSWLFPVYNYCRETNDEVSANILLLGSYHREQQATCSWFIPLYYYHNRPVPPDAATRTNRYQAYGKNFWCLPICWYRDEVYFRPESRPIAAQDELGLSSDWQANDSAHQSDPPLLRGEDRSAGFFPLWHQSDYRSGSAVSTQEASLLFWLYDFNHEYKAAQTRTKSPARDYTRARILWHLWHYERLNGDVSVDIFPAITYDAKVSGYRKTSFLWRLFRYERAADGSINCDFLFVPLRRS